MSWSSVTRLGAAVCAIIVATGLMAASPVVGSSPAAPASDATLSILHAIPAGKGADAVDVYAGRSLLAGDLAPGDLTVVKVPGGTYEIAVLPAGKTPGTASPLLVAPRTRIQSGANLTVAANLTTAGKPALTVFTNDTTTVGNGKGRLTVRHIAAAPPVDVRAAGTVLLSGLRNPRQASVGLNAGNYSIDIVLAGTRRVVLGPTTVTIKNRPGTDDMGTNTILYVWGSSPTLKLATQEVRIDLR